MKKVEPDSPNRCQGTTNLGQCQYPKQEDSDYCSKCNPTKEFNDKKKSSDLYRVERYKSRIARLRSHANANTLEDEVAILRMLLEEQLQKIENNVQLVIEAPRLSALVEKIEKAVVSCSKLKKQSGSTLDKVQLINFADKVVTIIDENISDKDIVNLIADKIIGEIPRDSETIT